MKVLPISKECCRGDVNRAYLIYLVVANTHRSPDQVRFNDDRRYFRAAEFVAKTSACVGPFLNESVKRARFPEGLLHNLRCRLFW